MTDPVTRRKPIVPKSTADRGWITTLLLLSCIACNSDPTAAIDASLAEDMTETDVRSSLDAGPDEDADETADIADAAHVEPDSAAEPDPDAESDAALEPDATSERDADADAGADPDAVTDASDAEAVPDSGDPAEAPNILLIIADDMGAEASSSYPALAGRNPQVATPNIEALAANGLVFDNAWATPVCSPTRATILSGEYGFRTGMTRLGRALSPATTVSLQEYIESSSPASYQMAVFGKWHVGPSIRHVAALGVDEFHGFTYPIIGDYYEWTSERSDGTTTDQTTYATTAFTDFAIEFIDRQSESDDPWFVYLAYNAPHGVDGSSGGFQVPPSDLHSIDLGELAPGDIEDTMQVYQSMIQAMDTEIGRLLDSIGPVGSPERDDTIVLFIGDNGTPDIVQDRGVGLRGAKLSILEGGIRVPLIVSGSGVRRSGERESALVASADLYATIGELSGIDASAAGDGVSFADLLSEASADHAREFAFSEICNETGDRFAIRSLRHKLTYDDGWTLYDLIEDPLENNDLYDAPEVAAEQAALEAELVSLGREIMGECL